MINLSSEKEFFGENDNKSSSQAKTNFFLSCNTNTDFAWCLPEDYNKEISPWHFRQLTNSRLPWLYIFEFNIIDIHEVDDQTQTVTLEMLFKIKWYEPRIVINVTSTEWKEHTMKVDGEDYVGIPISQMQEFWIPDIEVYRLKKYTTQNVLRPTASFRTNGNKLLRYVARVEMVLSCQMDFGKYPFDVHVCTSQQGSFYNTQGIVDCNSSFSKNDTKQRTLQYEVKVLDLPKEYHTTEVYGSLWATCGFQMVFTRKKIPIFFQVYLTSTLLVFVAWVSFLINPTAVPGRMGLLVTVFLVLINIFIGVKRDSPKSSGFLSAIDIFLVVCLGHVFCAILEYALVLAANCRNIADVFGKEKNEKTVLSTSRQLKTGPSQLAVKDARSLDEKIHMTPKEFRNQNPRSFELEEGITTFDRVSMICYPISFTAFIVLYLYFYLH